MLMIVLSLLVQHFWNQNSFVMLHLRLSHLGTDNRSPLVNIMSPFYQKNQFFLSRSISIRFLGKQFCVNTYLIC